MAKLSDFIQKPGPDFGPDSVEAISYSGGKPTVMIYTLNGLWYKEIYTYNISKDIDNIAYYMSEDSGSNYTLIRTETYNYTDGLFTGTTIT